MDVSESQEVMKFRVLISGCFDPLHPGHLEYFNRVSQCWPNAAIYCAVAPDDEVKRLKKRRVFQSQVDRLALVSETSGFIVEIDTAIAAIARLKPDVFAKGVGTVLSDELERQCERENVAIVFVATSVHRSSSQLLLEHVVGSRETGSAGPWLDPGAGAE